MKNKYLFETFKSSSSDFDHQFTNYLNDKYSDAWKVKHCEFLDSSDEKSASCMFKRKS
jgi:hypothetical protein